MKKFGRDMPTTQRSSGNTTSGVVHSPVNLGLRFLVCLLTLTGGLLPGHARAASSVWTKQPAGTMAWLRAVHFFDEARGWAVGGRGVLLSTIDGGKHWQVRRRPTEDNLLDVYFTKAATGWLVCEPSIYESKTKDEPRSYLLQTTNGGETWTRVRPTGPDVYVRIVRIIFADEMHGWVFGELGALYTTADGGATWTPQPLPTRHLLLGGAFLDAAQGWLVGAGATLLRTNDHGLTWRAGEIEMTDGAAGQVTAATHSPVTTRGAARLHAVSFPNARRGWAVGAKGQIFTTANGGRTWHAQTSTVVADLFDVKFFDEQEGWVAGADGTLLHTTDGGLHWRAESSGTTHPLERLAFMGRTRGWAVGFGGTILAYTPNVNSPPHQPKLKNTASGF